MKRCGHTSRSGYRLKVGSGAATIEERPLRERFIESLPEDLIKAADFLEKSAPWKVTPYGEVLDSEWVNVILCLQWAADEITSRRQTSAAAN
jgi:hypothetical protein